MPTIHYLWDFESDNVLMEKDDNGDTIAEYTHKPGEFGKLISQRRNGQTYFHHYDAQGSSRTVTDQSQNIVETATYSAFGETVAKTSTITNPFGFKGALGYYANPATEDFYVRARALDAEIARWLSRDPLLFASNDINLYRYAQNQPTIRSDPSGMQVINCSVYEYWCKETSWCNVCAKLYYCYAADIVCRNAGSGPWRDCVRSCLQSDTGTDWIETENTPIFGTLLGCVRTALGELAWNHLYCFSACTIDPDNY